jgi:hypothetical protein
MPRESADPGPPRREAWAAESGENPVEEWADDLNLYAMLYVLKDNQEDPRAGCKLDPRICEGIDVLSYSILGWAEPTV